MDRHNTEAQTFRRTIAFVHEWLQINQPDTVQGVMYRDLSMTKLITSTDEYRLIQEPHFNARRCVDIHLHEVAFAGDSFPLTPFTPHVAVADRSR